MRSVLPTIASIEYQTISGGALDGKEMVSNYQTGLRENEAIVVQSVDENGYKKWWRACLLCECFIEDLSGPCPTC